MAVRAFLQLAYAALLLPAVAADNTCEPDCPDPFPPGHRNIGDAWWAIGGETSGAYITQINTTLVVPPKPAVQVKGLRVINSPLDNSNVSDKSDSHAALEEFQIILAAFPDPPFGGCFAAEDEWCLFASGYVTPNPGNLSSGYSYVHFPMTNVNPGDTLQFNYTYTSDNELRISYQDLQLGPNISLFPQAQPQQPPTQWWPNTECHCSGSGFMPEHTYHDTMICLNTAVPDYDTHVISQNASYTPLYTLDGGVTWHIDTLTIHESYCENNDPICFSNSTSTASTVITSTSASSMVPTGYNAST